MGLGKVTHCHQLSAIYINNLAKEIINLNLGININNYKLSILLYADDMVLIANTETDLQKMLTTMYNWCMKWRLNINVAKSNVIHFRKKKESRKQISISHLVQTILLVHANINILV